MTDDDYFGPVGRMGAGSWHVTMRDGRHLKLRGNLEFTRGGSALVWDGDTPRLVLGLARGRWGSIVAEDGECEDWRRPIC